MEYRMDPSHSLLLGVAFPCSCFVVLCTFCAFCVRRGKRVGIPDAHSLAI